MGVGQGPVLLRRLSVDDRDDEATNKHSDLHCRARHPSCVLCLLLHRGLLAHLPISVEWLEALESS